MLQKNKNKFCKNFSQLRRQLSNVSCPTSVVSLFDQNFNNRNFILMSIPHTILQPGIVASLTCESLLLWSKTHSGIDQLRHIIFRNSFVIRILIKRWLTFELGLGVVILAGIDPLTPWTTSTLTLLHTNLVSIRGTYILQGWVYQPWTLKRFPRKSNFTSPLVRKSAFISVVGHFTMTSHPSGFLSTWYTYDQKKWCLTSKYLVLGDNFWLVARRKAPWLSSKTVQWISGISSLGSSRKTRRSVTVFRIGIKALRQLTRPTYSACKVLKQISEMSWDFQTRGTPPKVIM